MDEGVKRLLVIFGVLFGVYAYCAVVLMVLTLVLPWD